MRTLLFIAALAAAAGPALAADVKPVGPAKPANAAVTTSHSNIKSPPNVAVNAAAFDAQACVASGGTVTVNADKTQTCTYADGRKGRGVAVGRQGGAF